MRRPSNRDATCPRYESHRCAEGLEADLQVFGSKRLDIRFAVSTRSAALVVRPGLARLQKAASAAGIGTLGTHSLRHTYRSLLDSAGTPLAVQKKLMRHTDIRTTMNVYGDVITNQESEALAKIARLALANSTQTARGTA